MSGLDFLLDPEKGEASEWEWATVTSVAPLRIRIDGDTQPLAGTPMSLVSELNEDDRVRVQFDKSRQMGQSGARPIIVGRAGGSGAAGDWVPRLSETGVTPTRPLIRRDITHTLGVNDPNQIEFRVRGETYVWQNEWGAFRGRPGAHDDPTWVDSLFRAVLEAGDPTGAGSRRNAFELIDRRGEDNIVLWGIQWSKGVMQQGGYDVSAVFMLQADETVDDIPATLPKGTIIMRMMPDADEV